MLFKSSATVRETSPFSLGRILGATVGRVASTPTALFGLQEEAPSFYRNLSEEEADKLKEKFELRYGPQLSDTEIQLGGPAILHNIARIWHNRKAGIPTKLLGTVVSPVAEISSSLGRSSYYDPFADVVVAGNASPSLLRLALGNAAATNAAGGDNPTGMGRKFLRDVYGVSPYFGGYGLPLSLPLAVNSYVDAMRSLQSPEARRNQRRRMYSLLGTALGGGIGGGLATLNNIQGGSLVKSLLLVLAGLGGGALAGRGTSELINLLRRGADRNHIVAPRSEDKERKKKKRKEIPV